MIPSNIYYKIFEPNQATIKATLLVIHGMQEHCGRYENLAKYLAENGILVLLYDQLGHGKTAKIKDDFGFFTLNKPKEKLVSDAQNMANFLEETYPNVPHFVLGHSMGSFVTRCLLQVYGSHFDGAIIVGTGGRILGSGLIAVFLSLLNKIAPSKRSKTINSIFSKANNSHFKNEEQTNGTNWLSLDKANRTVFLNDPLCGIPFSINGYYALVALVAQATNSHWTEAIPKALPIHFISGANDPIGNFGKGVTQSYNDLKSHHFQDVTMQLYPEMRHEILNESIKEKVFADIDNWLNQKILKASIS